MRSVRRQRLAVALLVLVAAAVAAVLVALALQENMTYLHTPSDVVQGRAPAAGAFRLGGVVLEGSIVSGRNEGTREVEYRFVVTDRVHDYPVRYRGVLPDLFREGQSVVSRGRIDGDVFAAEEVLAKHDETYVPAEVKDKIEEAQAAGAAARETEAEAPPEPPAAGY